MTEARLDWLDRMVAGRVIRPGAPDYDDARRTFNSLIIIPSGTSPAA